MYPLRNSLLTLRLPPTTEKQNYKKTELQKIKITYYLERQ